MRRARSARRECPACVQRLRSPASGGRGVARSMSATGAPASVSRTAPPTTRASGSAASTAASAGSARNAGGAMRRAGRVGHRGAGAWPGTIAAVLQTGRARRRSPGGSASSRLEPEQQTPPAASSAPPAASTRRSGRAAPSVAISRQTTKSSERREEQRRAQSAAACGSRSPQLLRQMHQDRRGRAPDVVVRMRPDPVFPPPCRAHGAACRCGASGSSSTPIGSSNTASTSCGDGLQRRGPAAAGQAPG